jgi:hypothetical protein
MGFNTTLLILNDSLGAIKSNPEQFVTGILHHLDGGGDISVGGHVNAAHVMPTQHADVHRLYFTHRNSITELSIFNAATLSMLNREKWLRQIVVDEIKTAEQDLRALKRYIRENPL